MRKSLEILIEEYGLEDALIRHLNEAIRIVDKTHEHDVLGLLQSKNDAYANEGVNLLDEMQFLLDEHITLLSLSYLLVSNYSHVLASVLELMLEEIKEDNVDALLDEMAEHYGEN